MHSNYKNRCHFHKKMPKNLSQYNHFRWRLNCVCNYSEWNNGMFLHQARLPILLIGYLLNHAQMFGNLCTFYSDSLPYINSSSHYQAFFHTLLNCLELKKTQTIFLHNNQITEKFPLEFQITKLRISFMCVFWCRGLLMDYSLKFHAKVKTLTMYTG